VISGNKSVSIAILSVLGALAAADAGHEDEDGYKSNWMVAGWDCRGESAVNELALTLPERFVMPASAQVIPAWTQYQDCESR
jgi:hypothetical protein